jgi:hypothetical protein
MIKSSIAVLLAVAALGSVAAPAFATPAPSPVATDDSSSHVDGNYLDSDAVLARLRDQGVNATSVEHWGTLIRAFVIQEDGRQASKLFDRDTLKPVAY